jgi:hypothetical protein
MSKEFYISIEDEDGIVVCQYVAISIEMLETVSNAAGGLEDLISEYNEKVKRQGGC